jgi:hypothetical protein
MKLVFPNGEHGQVFLNPGVNRIGSDIDNAVVLNRPGILPVHAVIHISGTGANLQVPQGAGPVTVNGKAVPDIMGLRSGDNISFGNVQAKFAVVEESRLQPLRHGPDAGEDSGATRVRSGVPKFVLRACRRGFQQGLPDHRPGCPSARAASATSRCQPTRSRAAALSSPRPKACRSRTSASSNGTFITGKARAAGFLTPATNCAWSGALHPGRAGMEIPNAKPRSSRGRRKAGDRRASERGELQMIRAGSGGARARSASWGC